MQLYKALTYEAVRLVRLYGYGWTGFLPRLIWLRLASILIMRLAGTVMVSPVSSSITSFLLITTSASSQLKVASSAVGLQSLIS